MDISFLQTDPHYTCKGLDHFKKMTSNYFASWEAFRGKELFQLESFSSKELFGEGSGFFLFVTLMYLFLLIFQSAFMCSAPDSVTGPLG